MTIALEPGRAIRQHRAMRWWLVGVGVLLVLMGGVWTLQGLGLVGGSVMSGDRTWAVIGPVVAVAGLVAIGFGARRRR
jgi:hypothetical protein